MEIGTNEQEKQVMDEFDDIDNFELEGIEHQVKEDNPDGDSNADSSLLEQEELEKSGEESEKDFLTSLLESKGIKDRTKIKFETDEGEVEEKDWDTLSNEEKLNILNLPTNNPETDLDDAEAELINAIRNSRVTPSEYLQAIQQDAINRYIQNSQAEGYQYEVDQFSDDDLFVYDLMTRTGDITQEEALEALEKAKQNEALYAKQIGAIRNEYKTQEQENIRQAQLEQEELAQEQYEQFSNQVVEQINDFTEFSGYDLDMDDSDKDDLYEFITGTDPSGNNYFAKALSDPKILVQTAWFALNGEQMLDSITQYFQKEISQVREESYKKGLADAKDGTKKPEVVYKNKQRNTSTDVYDDLDDLDEF